VRGNDLETVLLEALGRVFLRRLVEFDAVAHCHTGYESLLTPAGWVGGWGKARERGAKAG